MISHVDGGVWRSPRPGPAEIAVIKEQFETVLSLEGVAVDAEEVKKFYPVLVVSHPISFWEIYFSGISLTELALIVAMIQTSPKPLLVHCQHGEDRTGLVIAAWRVAACGWTKARAMEEALGFGYRDWLNFGLNATWEKMKEKTP